MEHMRLTTPQAIGRLSHMEQTLPLVVKWRHLGLPKTQTVARLFQPLLLLALLN
jgi:hypothetical protein